MMNLNVIEGFYGKTWSWQDRKSVLDFIAQYGFQQYIYAPKADDYLRKHWQANWSQPIFAELEGLSQQAQSLDVGFGLGLSPVSLMDNWGVAARAQLKQRLEQIKALNPSVLAILFDDIQGDKSHLAQVQIEISHFIQECLPDTQLWVCPTYYTFDPILPELFGAMPEHYWQDLGQGLDKDIELLWTGDKVISDNYPLAGLEQITDLFQRKPIIWDNSRVNDGRKTSPFMPIKAMGDFSALEQHLSGVLVNPVNQAHWAMVNLSTLKQQGSDEQRLQKSLAILCPALKDVVLNNLAIFREVGFDRLNAQQKQTLQQQLETVNSPFANELQQWLTGYYQFDPACLT